MTEQPNRQKIAADGIAAPLRYTVFRRIWLASLLSNLGLLIQGVGAAWAMTQMAASADKVALVQTALMLPIMDARDIWREHAPRVCLRRDGEGGAQRPLTNRCRGDAAR